MVLQRFNTEFQQVIEENELDETAVIDQEKAIEIMAALGFITDINISPSEKLNV